MKDLNDVLYLLYIGSKRRLLPIILEMIPSHYEYIEPFGGTATVLLNKPLAGKEVYNDLNNDLVRFFEAIKDREKLDEIIYRFKLTLLSDTLQKNINNPDYVKSLNDIDFGVIMLFRFSLLYTYNYKKWFISYKRYNRDKLIDRIFKVAKRLESVMILNQDGLELIKNYYDRKRFSVRHEPKGIFFYIDPPYLDDLNGYGLEFTKNDHINLLNILQSKPKQDKVKFKFLLSTSENDLYLDWAKDNKYNIKKVDLSPMFADKKETQKEVLIYNYDIDPLFEEGY